MKKWVCNVVWLKRDLRLQDHAALAAAEQAPEDYLIVYLYEPKIIQHPDCSRKHLSFIHISIENLKCELSQYNRKVYCFYAEADEVFSWLFSQFQIHNLYSYQEHGTQITWDRDKAVAELCQKHGITWTEYPKNGVMRGISSRKNWDRMWYGKMSEKPIENVYSKTDIELEGHPFILPAVFKAQLNEYPKQHQKPGEKEAWKYLKSFCLERGHNYRKHISKPTESRKSCTRLSPYLAWGNLSVLQCVHYIKNSDQYPKNKAAFNAALTRLKWRDHFVQKFEQECSYEHFCINAGYEDLYPPENKNLIEAWKTGHTGFPMVDANMRCLIATGWINFRMRAMLVSFLCHHLFQDWRLGVYHLAQLFLDYEPGIHFPQFQMQAGVTGINTIRIYNPVKQGLDHDPDGLFIKKWLPELEHIPPKQLHEPWKLSSMEQNLYACVLDKDYPAPIVNPENAAKEARQRIWSFRKKEEVKMESKRILATHVRPQK